MANTNNKYKNSPQKDDYSNAFIKKFDRYPYLRYDDKYYTPAHINMYIGSILVDDITSIEYVVQNSKSPVYGYSSSNFDAIARGRILVTGSFTVNFRRAALLQVIFDYVKGNKKLTESSDDYLLFTENQTRLTDITAYYKYAHASLAYPVGYVEGTENARKRNELAVEVNDLLQRKETLLLQDPLINYPDHERHHEIVSINQMIAEKEADYYADTPIDSFNSIGEEGSKIKAPQFLNSHNTPYGGYYSQRIGIDKDGNEVRQRAPFVLQKNIAAALQRIAPGNNSMVTSQTSDTELNDLLYSLEKRIAGTSSDDKARIRRLDEHDVVMDEKLMKYIEDNSVDIMLLYGDTNTPEAEQTVKTINDVHILNESQQIAVGSGIIQQSFSFFARNIDERPLDSILNDNGEILTGDMHENIMDETNAIMIGEHQHKKLEWVYGHVENADRAYNHYQDFRPMVTAVGAREPEEEPEPRSGMPTVSVLPLIDCCNVSSKLQSEVRIGALLGLKDNHWVEYMTRKQGVDDAVVNFKEPLSDETLIKINMKLHLTRSKYSMVSDTISENEFDEKYPKEAEEIINKEEEKDEKEIIDDENIPSDPLKRTWDQFPYYDESKIRYNYDDLNSDEIYRMLTIPLAITDPGRSPVASGGLRNANDLLEVMLYKGIIPESALLLLAHMLTEAPTLGSEPIRSLDNIERILIDQEDRRYNFWNFYLSFVQYMFSYKNRRWYRNSWVTNDTGFGSYYARCFELLEPEILANREAPEADHWYGVARRHNDPSVFSNIQKHIPIMFVNDDPDAVISAYLFQLYKNHNTAYREIASGKPDVDNYLSSIFPYYYGLGTHDMNLDNTNRRGEYIQYLKSIYEKLLDNYKTYGNIIVDSLSPEIDKDGIDISFYETIYGTSDGYVYDSPVSTGTISDDSISKLDTCHIDLQNLIYECISNTMCPYPIVIIEGQRNREEQNYLYNNGFVGIDYPNSKFNMEPSMAVMISPAPVNWYGNSSTGGSSSGGGSNIRIPSNYTEFYSMFEDYYRPQVYDNNTSIRTTMNTTTVSSLLDTIYGLDSNVGLRYTMYLIVKKEEFRTEEIMRAFARKEYFINNNDDEDTGGMLSSSTDRYNILASFIKGRAEYLGIDVIWGGDWDGDVYDPLHWELI